MIALFPGRRLHYTKARGFVKRCAKMSLLLHQRSVPSVSSIGMLPLNLTSRLGSVLQGVIGKNTHFGAGDLSALGREGGGGRVVEPASSQGFSAPVS